MKNVLRTLILVSVVLLDFAMAGERLVFAPNLTPYALMAKQIAPGTTRAITMSGGWGSCDSSCHSEAESDASAFRLETNLFKLMWPKTENLQGSENYTGHTFGGGLFLDMHIGYLLETGVAPTFVQWIGPFYIGASYEVSVGHYVGDDAKGNLTFEHSDNLLTQTLNVGGGTMLFMNNHGLGFGAHGGLRKIHLVNAGYDVKAGYNSRSGEYESSEPRDGFHAEDWMYYMGLEYVIYDNLPLLRETQSKGHSAAIFSFEGGFCTKKTSLSYISLTMSILI